MINTLGVSGGGTGVTAPTDVFYYKMTIDATMFNHMMREEDVKDHYKNRLAFEIAKQLVETNRTKFSYTKDTIRDVYTIKGEVRL
jgi:ribosomal protein L13